jgi:predicted acetyltransferase
MVIRNPRGDETKKVYDLWQKCFHDPKPFADYFFENLYKPSNTICVFDGERLLSSLQIFYHTALFSGMLLKAAYIAGVSTHPRERNKGYASLLMNEAEKRLSGENIDIVTLIPSCCGKYTCSPPAQDIPSRRRRKHPAIFPKRNHCPFQT